ncbi:MAG: c-type cytochrome [Desulfuromonadales bacterium]
MRTRNLMGLIVALTLLIPVVACSSEDNSGQAESGQSANASVEKGEAIYEKNCASCHKNGVAGAPKLDDQAAWSDSLSKGKETLYDNSINGFKSMPPKGGNSSLSDEEVKAAVDYMVEEIQ